MQPLILSFRKTSFNRIAKAAVLVTAGVVLTGCATGKGPLTAADVVDDGKRNTILFSYDMTLNVTEKHPGVTNTDVVIRCGKPNRHGRAPECFRVNVPLKGRRNIDGYSYYTFTGSGAEVAQLPYGMSNVTSVGHSVVVDVERYHSCFGFGGSFGFGRRFGRGFGFGARFGSRFGIHGRSSCLPVSSFVTARFGGETPTEVVIDVKPGDGCYAGHLKLEMTDGALTGYSFDQTPVQPSDTLVESLPEGLQDTVRNRVTRPCKTG